jgi:hypothetical protein
MHEVMCETSHQKLLKLCKIIYFWNGLFLKIVLYQMFLTLFQYL